MKTMKKTCTTFLLAFVMLLACLFPAFAVKDTKKASALSAHDTLYYFSDSFQPLLTEEKISEQILEELKILDGTIEQEQQRQNYLQKI